MTLFDPGEPLPPAAQANQPRTSLDAALANDGYRRGLRGRILEAWFGVGEARTFTDEELTSLLDARYPERQRHYYPSVGKRRGELVELGWVEMHIEQDHPLTRMTSRGVFATVWSLTRAARDHGYPGEAL